jgi:hypothetical protein
VLKHHVEQGAEVLQRRRRRIPDFGDKGINIEQEPRLPLAHWWEVGPPCPGGVDCKGELMVLVLELSPSLVHTECEECRYSATVYPLVPDRDQHARRYDRRADYQEPFASELKFKAALPAPSPMR